MPVHELAVVDPAATIADDAVVGPFCVVGPDATIASGVELLNHVTVMGKSTIGEGTRVFPGAVIGGDPQDLKYRGENSEVRIGARCRIHECATINKGTAGGGMVTSLGDGVLIMAYAHVAHDCHLGDQVVLGNQAQLAGHVTIGRRAVVSGMVGVHHFVSIGELAFVAATSGVRTDVPPYLTVEGNPCEPRGVNLVGVRRDGWSDEQIDAAKDAYRQLWRNRNGTPVAEIIGRLREQGSDDCLPVSTWCEWLERQLDLGIKGRVQESFRS